MNYKSLNYIVILMLALLLTVDVLASPSTPCNICEELTIIGSMNEGRVVRDCRGEGLAFEKRVYVASGSLDYNSILMVNKTTNPQQTEILVYGENMGYDGLVASGSAKYYNLELNAVIGEIFNASSVVKSEEGLIMVNSSIPSGEFYVVGLMKVSSKAQLEGSITQGLTWENPLLGVDIYSKNYVRGKSISMSYDVYLSNEVTPKEKPIKTKWP